jgi:hypothetical protein
MRSMRQRQGRRAADRVRGSTKPAARGGIALEPSGPAQPRARLARRSLGLVLLLAVVAAAAAQYAAGPAVIPVAWLAVGPLLASLVLSPRVTAALAGWALLLAAGLDAREHGRPGTLAWHLSVCLLLVAFAVINSALRTAAQRRLSQVRAVARVAQSALLREVPETVTAARLASRYVSAAAESRVGGDLQPSTFAVHAGDRLLFCTDGLLEARDRADRYFRPEHCLDTLREPDLQAAADGLLDKLIAHTGRKLDDDVALLLLEITPTPAGPEQEPAAALAPGAQAVSGHQPLILTGAGAAASAPRT